MIMNNKSRLLCQKKQPAEKEKIFFSGYLCLIP